MIADAQGLCLTGATAEAAAHYDAAVRAFTLSYGDAIAEIDAARASAPEFALAQLAKAWIYTLANDAFMVVKARGMLDEARRLPMNERERVHAAALAHAVEGHRAAAVALLSRHLMGMPHDLLAHAAAMFLDAFLGRFPGVRDRTARALPLWPKAMPGYGILLSFYGFGLEEAGDYARAEDTSRAAAELEPYGYWPHHGVSHVLEMTGRPDEGLQWMTQREPFWSGKGNSSRVHIWWHKALFHVELGQYDEALAIYDGPIMETQRPAGVSLTNATALLWRLETLGYDAGDRWPALEKIWRGHADGRLCVFADVHAAMTALRADDGAELERLLAGMRKTAAEGSESSAVYREAGLPIVQGVAAFAKGDYAGAVEHLLSARNELWRIGGSYAQRDLIDWTLTEAAARAGQRHVALALANERLALRPESVPNKRFLGQAQALAA